MIFRTPESGDFKFYRTFKEIKHKILREFWPTLMHFIRDSIMYLRTGKLRDMCLFVTKVHIKNRIVLYNVSSISNGNLLRMFGLIKFSLIPGFWCFLSIWWNTSPTCVFFVLTKGLASLQYYINFQNMYIMAKSCKKLINFRCRLIVNCINKSTASYAVLWRVFD